MLLNQNLKNASAIIIHHKNKVLLNLRSNMKNIFYPNYWGLLGGAKKREKNFRLTAIRESLRRKLQKIIKKLIFFF